MSNDFSIFDSKGVRDLSSKADKAAIAALSPEHKEKLFAVMDAFTNSVEAGKRLKAATETVNTRIIEHNAADQAFQGLRPWIDLATGDKAQGNFAEPKIDHRKKDIAATKAAQAVQAAQRPGYKPAPVEVDPLQVALEKAATALSAAYVEVREAQNAVAVTSRDYGQAVNAWRVTLSVNNFDTNVKDHLAKQLEQRAARVAKGLSPEYQPVVTEPEYQTPFDAARSGARRKAVPLIRR
jgi:hypothetical protein